ncbi:anaerobic C4-dicarboxylate transporter family protein [Actinoplanes sp. NPDC049668]|uniref:anaerobic C4-dicarboxylate transporter family protein n=1 Tax=unclassified Actinoplanes TaxID=2626549 RepID=UPI0033AC80A6
MDAALIVAQGIVVIVAILLGVRMGGIGLGLWGLVGLAVLPYLPDPEPIVLTPSHPDRPLTPDRRMGT